MTIYTHIVDVYPADWKKGDEPSKLEFTGLSTSMWTPECNKHKFVDDHGKVFDTTHHRVNYHSKEDSDGKRHLFALHNELPTEEALGIVNSTGGCKCNNNSCMTGCHDHSCKSAARPAGDRPWGCYDDVPAGCYCRESP